jgi:sarcosine oxidase subunit gamma
MAERLSSLGSLLPAAPAGAGFTLREMRPASILQLQAWPGTLDAVRRAVAELLTVDAPILGEAAVAGGLTICAVAPGRFLIASDDAGLAARFEGTLTADEAAVTDLSHGRVVLRLEGADAEAVLQGCLRFDLDSTAFPPGRVGQSMIHHIDVVVVRQAEGAFELWCLRSFARSLAEWLLDAGLGHGTC